MDQSWRVYGARIGRNVEEQPPKRVRCRPISGRCRLLTAESQELIRAGIAGGLFTEHAVRRAGVSAAAYYDWMAGAKAARTKLDAGEVLTDREERFLQFAEAVEEAEAESEALLVGRIVDAGAPRMVRRITVAESPLWEDGRLVRDTHGEPVFVATRQVQESEVFDWRPNLQVLKRRFPERWGDRRRTEPTSSAAGPVEVFEVTGTERRLSESIRRFRERMPDSLRRGLDEWYDAPMLPPTTATAVVDDADDEDDACLVPWSTLDYEFGASAS